MVYAKVVVDVSHLLLLLLSGQIQHDNCGSFRHSGSSREAR